MSLLQIAVLCILSVSFTSAQLDNFRALVCKKSICDMCRTRRNNNIWCTVCACGVQNEDLCASVRCGFGRICEVVQRGGWFPRNYAVCVDAETTTTSEPTTTPTTTVASTTVNNGDGLCEDTTDCRVNEFCQTNVGEEFGTCRPINQRSISPKCFEDKKIGPCRAADRRYFFNTTTSKCQAFFYGGCNPSENNFLSMEECVTDCEVDETREDDPCTLPRNPGICRAIFVSYFFNTDTGKCESFQYGGCGGNANRWDSMEGCQDRCENRPN